MIVCFALCLFLFFCLSPCPASELSLHFERNAAPSSPVAFYVTAGSAGEGRSFTLSLLDASGALAGFYQGKTEKNGVLTHMKAPAGEGRYQVVCAVEEGSSFSTVRESLFVYDPQIPRMTSRVCLDAKERMVLETDVFRSPGAGENVLISVRDFSGTFVHSSSVPLDGEGRARIRIPLTRQWAAGLCTVSVSSSRASAFQSLEIPAAGRFRRLRIESPVSVEKGGKYGGRIVIEEKDGRPCAGEAFHIVIADAEGKVLARMERETSARGDYDFVFDTSSIKTADFSVRAEAGVRWALRKVRILPGGRIVNLLPSSPGLKTDRENRIYVSLTDLQFTPISGSLFVKTEDFKKEVAVKDGVGSFSFVPKKEGEFLFDICLEDKGEPLRRIALTAEKGGLLLSEKTVYGSGEPPEIEVQASSRPLLFHLHRGDFPAGTFLLSPGESTLSPGLLEPGIYRLSCAHESEKIQDLRFVVKEAPSSPFTKAYIPGELVPLSKDFDGRIPFFPVEGGIGYFSGKYGASETLEELNLSLYTSFALHDALLHFSLLPLLYPSCREADAAAAALLFPPPVRSSCEQVGFLLSQRKSGTVGLPDVNYRGTAAFYNGDGLLSAAFPIDICQPFQMALPAADYGTFVAGDEIYFPVGLTNYTAQDMSVNLILARRRNFAVDGSLRASVSLKPWQEGYYYYKMTFGEPSIFKMAVGGSVGELYEEKREDLTVVPAGYENVLCRSGVFEGGEVLFEPAGEEGLFLAEFYNSLEALREGAVISYGKTPAPSSREYFSRALLEGSGREAVRSGAERYRLPGGGFCLYANRREFDFMATALALMLLEDPRDPAFAALLSQKDGASEMQRRFARHFLSGRGYDEKRLADFSPADGSSARTVSLWDRDPSSGPLKPPLSSFQGKYFWKPEQGSLSGAEGTAADLEMTALAAFLLPPSVFSEEEKAGMTRFLLECRLGDGTWGSAFAGWLVLSALENLCPDSFYQGVVQVSGGDEPQFLFDFDESLIRKTGFSVKGKEPVRFSSSGKGRCFYFVAYKYYTSEPVLSKKLVTLRFTPEKAAQGERVNASLSWKLPGNAPSAFLVFHIPWGMSVPDTSLEKLKESGMILGFERPTPDRIFFLVEREGMFEFPMLARFPGKVTVRAAEITSAENRYLRGYSLFHRIEVTGRK